MSQEGMLLETAEENMGMGNTPYDKDRIYNNYVIMKDVHKANNEPEKIGDLEESKSVLLIHLGENQLQKTGHFELQAPWENSCDRCKGTAIMFKLEKTEIEVGCHDCAGDGYVKKKCPVCRGTKRHIREYTALKINVKCTHCDEDGKSNVKCPICRGHGRRKKLVNTGKIASSSPCKMCKGTGKKPPKELKKVFNAKLQTQLAAAILQASEEV